MSDLETTISEEAAPPRRRSLLGRVLMGLAIVLVLIGSLFIIDRLRSNRAAGDLARQLEEKEPGWRLEDLEGARKVVAEEKNSARQLMKVVKLMPANWPTTEFIDMVGQQTGGRLLSADRFQKLQEELERLKDARDLARPLADMPQGRHHVHYRKIAFGTLLHDQTETRRVAYLLRYAALEAANRGDVSEAVRWGRSLVCAARSIGDEPMLITQLIRVAILGIAVAEVEHALSLGEAKEAELIALEKLLEDEQKVDPLLIGLRGDRAMLYQFFHQMATGAMTTQQMHQEFGMRGTLLDATEIYPRRQYQRSLPLVLETMTEMVEVAKKPPHEQEPFEIPLNDRLRPVRQAIPLFGGLYDDYARMPGRFRNRIAEVACMRLGLAAERYRMKQGKFPTKLENLMGEYVRAIPLDPFDGKPLRMAADADGIVIYSVGPDKMDDGGKIDRQKRNAPGTDVGFRLWELKARRQPALPEEMEK